jgi:ADP-ribose pyrophosphatase YjhB (NUDIX family)
MDDAFRIVCCPACGAKVVERLADGRMRPVCPECGRVHFADPKVAAAVLIEYQGRLLLVRRTNEPERGRWTLPAGYVDAGEDPRQAAARECLEETGLAVDVGVVQDVLFETGPGKVPTIVIVFRGTIQGGRLIPGDDASEAAFFDPAQLPELGFESTRRAISDWRRAAGGTNAPA